MANSANPNASAICKPCPGAGKICDVDHRQRRGDQDHQQITRVAYPEDRVPIEQKIAQRAATDSGKCGQRKTAEQIHIQARRGKYATHREHGDTDQIEQIEHRNPLGVTIVRLAQELGLQAPT